MISRVCVSAGRINFQRLQHCFGNILTIVIMRKILQHLLRLTFIGACLFTLLIGGNYSSSFAGTKSDTPNLSGTIRVTGNGPEEHILRSLAQAFEDQHTEVSIDIFWHTNVKPVRTLELHESDIGITGFSVPHLRSTTVARDGIAVLTNFSNPVSELTKEQLAEVFSGKTRFWSQVFEEAPEMKIKLINRSNNQNIRQGFIQALGIKRIGRSAKVIESERHAINAVTGDLATIAFVSMSPSLRAREDGVAINLLFIDGVEPEYQTVLDKSYPIQRPVVFLTQLDPDSLVLAFEQFVLSAKGQRLIRKSGLYYPLSDE